MLLSVSQTLMDAFQCGSHRTTRLKYVLFRHVCKDSLPINFPRVKEASLKSSIGGKILTVSLKKHFQLTSRFAERRLFAGSPLGRQLSILPLLRTLTPGAFMGRYQGVKNQCDNMPPCPKQIQVLGRLQCILGPRALRSDRTNFKSWPLPLTCCVTSGEWLSLSDPLFLHLEWMMPILKTKMS